MLRYLLQQEAAVLLASGLSGATTAALMGDELGCKLNGYVGATATREERAALRAEVRALAAARGVGAAALETALDRFDASCAPLWASL